MYRYETEAVVQSVSKACPESPFDVVTIIHEGDSNDVVAEYKGVRYTAIFNPFVCRYYVDDLYGKLPDQHQCPTCGKMLD